MEVSHALLGFRHSGDFRCCNALGFLAFLARPKLSASIASVCRNAIYPLPSGTSAAHSAPRLSGQCAR
jgi:hypothetical protein